MARSLSLMLLGVPFHLWVLLTAGKWEQRGGSEAILLQHLQSRGCLSSAGTELSEFFFIKSDMLHFSALDSQKSPGGTSC